MHRFLTACLPLYISPTGRQLSRQRIHARAAITLTFIAALGGCAAPSSRTPVAELQAALPGKWHAPLPHGGSVVKLSNWWQRFDDPLLVRLISAAQEVSPTIADAKSRIDNAKARHIRDGAARLPQLSANVGASRGQQDFNQPVTTGASASLQLAWELDVFGGQSAVERAAQARFEGAQAQWHDARVTVAAEVANAYTALRACEAISAVLEIDAASRAETARLTELTVKSGLQSPANAALARASTALGQMNLVQQRAVCESQIKALVALTATPETELRMALGPSTGKIAQAEAFIPDQLPAQALVQRPDLANAAQEVLAASADISASNAQRYPRIALSGSIGTARMQMAMGNNEGTVWSLGPIQLTLPVFDAGARRANIQAAQARHEAALSNYRAALRNAVRDVEQALLVLHSTADRAQDAQIAAESFRASLRATQARQQSGLASLFELEDALRSDGQAQTAVIELQRERMLAWTSLYRALGGGWDGNARVQSASIQP